MDCCFPPLFELCNICYCPCSIFQTNIIENELSICNDCYYKVNMAKLDPEYKRAHQYDEKCKWHSGKEMYSLCGPYALNKWGQVVGDIVDNKILLRTFLPGVCFLCKGKVSTLKEVYIHGYLFHYECSKLCI